MATAKLGERMLIGIKSKDRPYEIRDTDLRGFLLRVEPSGRKSYFAEYRRADGRRTRIKIGDASVLKVEEARHQARKKLIDVAEGGDPQGEKTHARRNSTLEDFIKSEFAAHVAQKKSGVKTLELLRANFGFLMRTKLDAINKADVMRWQNRCAHKGRKASTINRNCAALRGCLSYAVELGVLESHPLAGLKDRKNDSTPKVRFLVADEETRLYAALDTREERRRQERDNANAWRRQRGYNELPAMPLNAFTDHLYPMVLVSLHTGIRRGECFALRWQDIDLHRAILTVRAESAKSGKERHIPLNNTALDALSRWQTQAGAESGLVFPSADGGKLDNTRKAWAGILRDAALENFTWHSMRHDFASKLVMAGIDLNCVREMLGHADYRTTLVYAHLAPEHKAAAVRVLERQPANVLSFSPAQAADAGTE